MPVDRMGDWSALKTRNSDDAFMALLMTKTQTPTHKRNGEVAGIHELHFTPSPHKGNVYTDQEDVFCNRENVDQCVAYINSELTTLGFKSMYHSNSETFDIVLMVNNMYELLKLHQKSNRIRETLEANKQRTDNDIDHLQQHTTRLKETVKEYEREIGRFEEKERQLLNKNKSIINKLKSEKDEVKRLMSVMSHRDAQYKHDQKKKEREVNKLKERLHQLLTDKNQERRIGMDILNSLQRADGKRGTWKTGSKHEEDMYRLIIGNYEEKQKELMVENDQLRQCLRELQRELISVVNHSALESPLKSEIGLLQDSTIISDRDDDMASISTTQSMDELSDGYFNMPVDMVREGIEKSFKEKCRHLKEVVRGSFRRKLSMTGSPDSLSSSIQAEQTEKLSQELVDKTAQLDRYKEIIEQQEQILQTMQTPVNENFSSSFFNDSEILEEKNQLTEERKLFYQQKANFEEERKNFTDAAIRLGRERKNFEDERAQLLQQQFLQMSPFTTSQLSSSAGRSSSVRKGSVGDHGAKLMPSTPCFSPAPKINNSTPSTGELYRTLGLRHDDQKENRSSGSSRNNSPRSFQRDFSTTSSGKSSRKSSTTSRSASRTSNTRVAEHVDNLKMALFNKHRAGSVS